jgi:hypothetical protein
MGGSSKEQQTQQQSQTAPWAPAQPLLGGILGKLSGSLQNGDLTSEEWDALSKMQGNAAGGNPYAGGIGSLATDLLNGGGPDRTGMVNDAYAQYQKMLQPFARGDYVDPSSNPTLQKYLQTIQDGVSNQVNGMFAGAGRDLSGANQQTLSRGIAQGEAPVLYDAYNAGVQGQRSAIDSLYGAGGQTAGLLSGLDQARLGNRSAGVGAAGAALDARNYGPQQTLAIEAARRGIPLSYLQQIAGMGMGIAGLGGQSQGQSNTQTKSTPGAYEWASLAPKYFGGGKG